MHPVRLRDLRSGKRVSMMEARLSEVVEVAELCSLHQCVGV